ncbi:MAG: hypothetical protein NVSMB19_19940 [Vulcanimicrobiaceae bacterium]
MKLALLREAFRMARPSRFFLIAVGTAAMLWLVASGIGVSSAVLQRSVIVFGFAGVVAASAVEALLVRRQPPKPTAMKTGSDKP